MTLITKTMKQPATRVALQKIKQLIFSGDLIADSNHLETELATRLGMSRTPIREATLILQENGLLDVQPRKGIKIKAIAIEDIRDYIETLTELECIAINRAASTGLNNGQLTPVNNAIKQIEKALEKADRTSWSIADETFHNEIVRLGGNKHILDIVSNINDQLRRLRTVMLQLRPLPIQSHQDHIKLRDAIADGNALIATDIHREHRYSATTMVVATLRKAGLKRV